ncbi:MAG TPA: 50S ribosomal protein L1 [Candidatus Bathyarchaeia archaeon]|nr:50S ribosomal protein L1 [Candidatus Bathyarchaeia archaeon]
MPLSKDAIAKALSDVRSKTEKRKFTQSIELSVKLRELDLKKPEARINENLELPTPADKNARIAVIAGGDLAIRARNAGADIIIGREDLDKLGREKKQARKIAQSYDFFVAEAPLMPQVGKTLGQMLGPRGKMPTPIPPTAPIDDIIKRQRHNVRLKMKDQPVVQCKVGTEDMPDDVLAQNIQTVISRLEAKLEKGPKNIKAVAIKASMGPPVKIPLTAAA